MRIIKITPMVYSKVFNWFMDHKKEAEIKCKGPEHNMKIWCLIDNEKVELEICEDGDTDAKYIIDGMDRSLNVILIKKKESSQNVQIASKTGGEDEG